MSTVAGATVGSPHPNLLPAGEGTARSRVITETREASSPFSPAGRDARASGSEGKGVVCERIEVRAGFNSLPRHCVARDRYDVGIVAAVT